ncbi:hypothetical protein C823_007926 [Eubacterium plexicaudatum ASF492]|nr:hypothetical protein C823_007926 [Eubacterium plexicaudatum ASF492]
MDIDYMERFKDFTVDAQKFPDFPAFVTEMKEQGVHLVPIIDAGVKVEEGYPIYEEGYGKIIFARTRTAKILQARYAGQIAFSGRAEFPKQERGLVTSTGC